MNLNGKTCLITGASRGLGRALAETLTAAGARVAMVARDGATLEQAAANLPDAVVITADIGDPEAAAAIAGQAHAALGTIDVLIHNASTLGALPMPILLDTEPADLERVLAVNLVGPFALTRAIAGSMVLRQAGVIVAISSDAAIEPYPGWGSYGTSKAALDHLTRILAAELSDTGVRIFSVDPGEMRTQMHADAIPDADPQTLADPSTVAARIAKLIADPGLAPSGSRVVAAEVLP